jgi:hypothetical protein
MIANHIPAPVGAELIMRAGRSVPVPPVLASVTSGDRTRTAAGNVRLRILRDRRSREKASAATFG